jgi:hypothetical protein
MKRIVLCVLLLLVATTAFATFTTTVPMPERQYQYKEAKGVITFTANDNRIWALASIDIALDPIVYEKPGHHLVVFMRTDTAQIHRFSTKPKQDHMMNAQGVAQDVTDTYIEVGTCTTNAPSCTLSLWLTMYALSDEALSGRTSIEVWVRIQEKE